MSDYVLEYSNAWVDLVNEALARIGSDQITSLDDTTNTAMFCSNLLPSALRTVFGLHNWTCSITRALLTPVSDETPPFEFLYYYNLPTKYIRLIEISTSDYKIEGNRLLSNEESIQIVYTVLPEDPTTISPTLLRETVVALLAHKLSTPLTGSAQLANSIYSEFASLVAEAKIQNDISVNENAYIDDLSNNDLWINRR